MFDRMPSKRQYNLVQNDDYDTRIPLHPEEAFQHGISFQAKYIGTLEVPRPTSRVEIVAAMRRIRYEFKAKGVKKRKVSVEVSVEGVRVTLRKKKKKKESGKKWSNIGNRGVGGGGDADGGAADDDGTGELMHHPIYRIFYVSHDSSDLKIFSYIARDGATNSFKCNVFKSNKKSQAMRIVRTVGQAFEVCHKLSLNSPPSPEPPPGDIASTSDLSDNATKEAVSEPSASGAVACASTASAVSVETPAPLTPSPEGLVPSSPRESAQQIQRPQRLDLPQQLTPTSTAGSRKSPQLLDPSLSALTLGEASAASTTEACSGGAASAVDTPLSARHELQLLRERLEQQSQQTRAAVAQLLLLRDQLAAEQAARCEAQARTHQLLIHNKELLDHISALVAHLQEREKSGPGAHGHSPVNVQQLTMVPQLSSSAKIDRWFSLLPPAPALSRPESGFVSGGAEDNTVFNDAPSLTEARSLLLRLGAKKRKRILGLKLGKVTTF